MIFTIAMLLLSIVRFTNSQPTINYPINSQLPPVARVDEPFSYTFSQYTFRSGSNISYSLGNAPEWLSIDSESRRLYGIPTNEAIPSGDVVGQTIEVIARDDSGSTTLSSTLVISRNKSPSIRIPLLEQIEGFGDYSPPSSLTSYPSTDISFTFDSETFDHQPNMINYYATSGDGSPLPAWMRFDANTLTFSGQTPSPESLIQPPQTFDFELVASDIVGFSAVSVAFSVVVGRHRLSSDDPVIAMNTTRGKKLVYRGLADNIKLDNKPVDMENIEISTDGLPKWLSLDENTWDIEGTPGKSDHSTNFTITMRDPYQDTLNIYATVNVSTALFRSTFDGIEIEAGKDVNINLEPYFWDPEDIDLDISITPNKDWLKLNGFNITGKAPVSASQDFKISVKATSKTSGDSDTEVLEVNVLQFEATSSSTTGSRTSSTSSSTSTSVAPTEISSGPGVQLADSDRGLTTGTLLLAILLPLLVVVFLSMLLICCLLRRRRQKQQTYLSSKLRNKISRPVLDSLRVNGGAATMQETNKVSSIGGTGQQPRQALHTPHSKVDSGTLVMISPTLGFMVTPQVPPMFFTEDSNASFSWTNSISNSDDGRRSWVTVEEPAMAAGRQSRASFRSRRSSSNLSESTDQLIPPPELLSDARARSFRRDVDPTVPSLNGYPSIHSQRAVFQQGSEYYTSANDSSLAFASSHQSSPRLLTGAFSAHAPGSRFNTATAEGEGPSIEAAQSMPILRRPELVRLSSQQLLGEGSRPSSRAWYDLDIPRGLFTDPSFGSRENWRVYDAQGDTTNMSYHQLVDESPFHPLRPSTAMSSTRDGAQPGQRASSELISPSQWGDGPTSIKDSLASLRQGLGHSMSKMSRLSVDPLVVPGSQDIRPVGSSSMNWRREDSGRKSDGGSYAFL
ncbi:axial budding pattern 2 [Fusarium sporotrichioides]|uniref:Axial budding pattern 2 n=1 Tax=Fusarium sporotrichioides TaxID=5514 RepID=A0A395RZJ7_FUSSP|nr:axial budding pattern 2 [Fusarium sporotrichioides]